MKGHPVTDTGRAPSTGEHIYHPADPGPSAPCTECRGAPTAPQHIKTHPRGIDTSATWQLIEGEALKTLEQLPDQCASAIICDPPYSSGGFTRGDRMAATTNKYVQTSTQLDRPDFAGDNRDQRGYLRWCSVWMAEALRVTEVGGSLLVFTDWRQLPTTTDAVQCGGWIWRGIIPWDKGEGTRPRRGGFRSQAEYIVWATAGPLRTDHDEYLPGWLWATIRPDERLHITSKPVAVMRELARIAPPGSLIVDPFAGAGTTGVGALEQGRRFLGVELTSSYAEIARERLAVAEATPRMFAEPSMGYDNEPLFEMAPDIVDDEASGWDDGE